MSPRATPSRVTVARAQLRFLMHSRYVYAVLLLLFAVIAFIYRNRDPLEAAWKPPLIGKMMFVFIAVGGIAALTAWINEAPGNRRYHWLMPVPRETHDLLRVAAGAAWLLLAIAFFCVFAWFAAPLTHREAWLDRAPWFWFGLFAGPLLAYLLVTIPALLVGRPIVWVLAILLVGVTLTARPLRQHAPFLYNIGSALFSFDRAPSLGVAFTGGDRTAPWASGDERYRLYMASVGSTPVRTQQQMMMNFVQPYPVRSWLKSLALWYGIALLGLALALTRRPNV